jgi:hypothetical protein
MVEIDVQNEGIVLHYDQNVERLDPTGQNEEMFPMMPAFVDQIVRTMLNDESIYFLRRYRYCYSLYIRSRMDSSMETQD